MTATKGKEMKLEDGILTIQIDPLSIPQLKDKYGIGDGGFRADLMSAGNLEKFSPDTGIYEFNFKDQHNFASWDGKRQRNQIPSGWTNPHASLLLQALLRYYNEKGKVLIRTFKSKTRGGLLSDCAKTVHESYYTLRSGDVSENSDTRLNIENFWRPESGRLCISFNIACITYKVKSRPSYSIVPARKIA